MVKAKSYKLLVIRRSCLTGKVVWVYRCSSKGAARVAYHRACRNEVKRMRHWGETAAQRRANIMKVLNECLADIPLDSALSNAQKAAARRLQAISKEDIACHREFYEHIIEERRRRAEDKEIRKQMRTNADEKII